MDQVSFDNNIISQMIEMRNQLKNNEMLNVIKGTNEKISKLDINLVLQAIILYSQVQADKKKTDLLQELKNTLKQSNDKLYESEMFLPAKCVFDKTSFNEIMGLIRDGNSKNNLIKDIAKNARDGNGNAEHNMWACAYMKQIKAGKLEAYVVPTVLFETFQGLSTKQESRNKQVKLVDKRKSQDFYELCKFLGPKFKIVKIEEQKIKDFKTESAKLTMQYYAFSPNFRKQATAEHDNLNDGLILAESTILGLPLISFNTADYYKNDKGNIQKELLQINKELKYGEIGPVMPNKENTRLTGNETKITDKEISKELEKELAPIKERVQEKVGKTIAKELFVISGIAKNYSIAPKMKKKNLEQVRTR